MAKRYEDIKNIYERDTNSVDDGSQGRVIEDLRTKLQLLEAKDQVPDDSYKKLSKAQKDNDSLIK